MEQPTNQPYVLGKGCPFRVSHYCNEKCGLYVKGIHACVFHAINQNLGSIKQSMSLFEQMLAKGATQKNHKEEEQASQHQDGMDAMHDVMA